MTTKEELEALPAGSVVVSRKYAWFKEQWGEYTIWLRTGSTHGYRSNAVAHSGITHILENRIND